MELKRLENINDFLALYKKSSVVLIEKKGDKKERISNFSLDLNIRMEKHSNL